MNVSNLILNLKSKITGCDFDQQSVSKAVKLLAVNAVFTVNSVAELPTASANKGKMYFVLYDGLYYSNGVVWVPIVQSAGILYAWGQSTGGKLGDNSTANKSSPVSVVGGFTNWTQVSNSWYSSIGLRSNGTLWAWGCNSVGQLGDCTTVSKSSPVSVVGGFTDWCQVSMNGTASTHSLGLRRNGTIWGWGANGSGQLGDCTITNRSSPVSVVGGFTDWCQISAGSATSLAVRSNGTAWGWGSNYCGKLGNNATTGTSSPVSVVGGFTDWCQVSSSASHSLGLRTNCTLWAWGAGANGVLGDNTVAAKSSPVSVIGGFTDWCQASAGWNHSLAVRTNGSLWAWGLNTCGILGNNSTVATSSPVSVIGGFTDWCGVSGGARHSLAVRTNGTLWAWGQSGSGQLGNNTITSVSSPVSVVGGFTNWNKISAGGYHSLAILTIA